MWWGGYGFVSYNGERDNEMFRGKIYSQANIRLFDRIEIGMCVCLWRERELALQDIDVLSCAQSLSHV